LIDIGPKQLTIALPIYDSNTIHLHRLPQDDLSITVAHDLVSKDHLAKIKSLLLSIQTKSSIRIIKFKTQTGKRSDATPLFPPEADRVIQSR
jgi:hypothetical protein